MTSLGISRFFKGGHVVPHRNVAIVFSVATFILTVSSQDRVLAQVAPDNPSEVEGTAFILEGTMGGSSLANIANKGGKCSAIEFYSSLQLPKTSVFFVEQHRLGFLPCTAICAATCKDARGDLYSCIRSGLQCISCPP